MIGVGFSHVQAGVVTVSVAVIALCNLFAFGPWGRRPPN